MFLDKSLRGRNIAVLMADGFEHLEYAAPVAALRAAGAEVDVISLRRGRIRGVNLHEPARKVRVDKLISEVKPVDYDGLYIPGGYISPDLLRQSKEARELVRAFDVSGKPIASLCHGTWVLSSANLVRGRQLTSWPGIRDDMVNAGATWLDRDVVRDRNWVTSRGPQDIVPFVRAILELYSDPALIPMREDIPVELSDSERAAHQATSAPQRDIPPRVVLSALKWIPKPSARIALSVGSLLAGAFFLRRQRAAQSPGASH